MPDYNDIPVLVWEGKLHKSNKPYENGIYRVVFKPSTEGLSVEFATHDEMGMPTWAKVKQDQFPYLLAMAQALRCLWKERQQC